MTTMATDVITTMLMIASKVIIVEMRIQMISENNSGDKGL